VLDYVGGSLLDEPGCIRFVTSCKVPGGGFAQRPGGKPDVVTTALGLMAAGELKIDDKAMIDAAVAYFRANTKAFEEVRMSIAGLEAVGARSPDFPRWAEQLEAMRRGCLYDESRRNKVLVKASSEALSTLKKNDWNYYYPGKKDHHKRVTTENTEGHGKGKLIRILFSVYFGEFRG